MSKQSEEQALQQGHEAAMTALSAQKEQTAALPPGDRLYWWLGFLAAAMGSAQSSIGEPAFRALRRSLMDDTDTDDATVGVPRRIQATGGLDLQKTGTYTTGDFGRSKKDT